MVYFEGAGLGKLTASLLVLCVLRLSEVAGDSQLFQKDAGGKGGRKAH